MPPLLRHKLSTSLLQIVETNVSDLIGAKRKHDC